MTKAIVTPTQAACVEITREFDAPRDLVFRAHTDPELIAQWLGPRKNTTTIKEFDVRDGGRWRYISSDDEGNEYGFRGVFHGMPSPDAIVQTWEFEGAPGNVSLERLRLEEVDGKTTLHAKACYLDVEALEADLAHGMEAGMQEGYDRLDELVHRLAPLP